MLKLVGLLSCFVLVAGLGCNKCEDLRKFDCSKTADKEDCENWKQTVLAMDDSSACKDNLENNSAFKVK